MPRTQIATGAFVGIFFQLQNAETGKNAEQRSQRTQNSTPEARTNSVEKQYYQKNKSNQPAGLIGLMRVAENRGHQNFSGIAEHAHHFDVAGGQGIKNSAQGRPETR